MQVDPEMMDHPTKQELDEYRWRVLAPAAFLSVHRHVTACSLCAAQCNQPGELARDLDDLQTALLNAPDDTPYHLSAKEVIAYTRGELDQIDLEIAESHLNSCATCLNEVQRHAETTQSLALPVLAISPVVYRRQSWRIVAFVSCGIVLILLGLWLVRMRRVEPEQATGPTNVSSPQTSPTVAELPSGTPGLPVEDFALVVNDGRQKITLDKQGTLAGLEMLPSPAQQRVRAALETGKLNQPSDLVQLAGRQSTLLGDAGNGLPFRLIGPLGQVVRTRQPTLRWQALAGAQSYQVIVTDSNLNEVAASAPLNTTQWRISKPLKPGATYSWQVTAIKDGVKVTSPVLPAPQAQFKVLDHSNSELLQKAERAYPDSHLTLGVLYAEAGLLDEAERELRQFISNNPRVGIAQKLLQNVIATRAPQK